jgi:DNA uptake protein ComE-like DNA-binding protein
MSILKSHLRYNKRQRNGILFLLFLIIILQAAYYFLNFKPKNAIVETLNLKEKISKELDSLEVLSQKDTLQIFPFNPNYLTDYKGYQLGMSVTEIDRLLKYRETGKFINSANEFQKITKVSDSLLMVLKPFFKFPDWVKTASKEKKEEPKFVNKNLDSIIDLNSATLEQLISIKGIGETLANRIINYRTKLQGYSFNDQLFEVWNLEQNVANAVLKQFQVIERPVINKININTASFKEVLGIVYLDYELTKKIFQYKNEVAEIQSLEELKKIEGFPIEKFNRIALYLEAK